MNHFSKIVLTFSLVVGSQTFSMLRLTRPLTRNSSLSRRLISTNRFGSLNELTNTFNIKRGSIEDLNLLKQEIDEIKKEIKKEIREKRIEKFGISLINNSGKIIATLLTLSCVNLGVTTYYTIIK